MTRRRSYTDIIQLASDLSWQTPCHGIIHSQTLAALSTSHTLFCSMTQEWDTRLYCIIICTLFHRFFNVHLVHKGHSLHPDWCLSGGHAAVLQVVDTQPLRASAVVRLDEPADVILAVVLVGTAGGGAAAAGVPSDAAASCPPLLEMEAAMKDGVFAIRNATVALKLELSLDHDAGLETCVLPVP